MIARPLLLTLLTACGLSNPTADPADELTQEPEQEQHFCCKAVDPDTRTGTECVLAGKEHLGACTAILYCPGFYTLEDGVVTCPS